MVDKKINVLYLLQFLDRLLHAVLPLCDRNATQLVCIDSSPCYRFLCII